MDKKWNVENLSRNIAPAIFATVLGLGSVGAYADVSLNATGGDGKVTLSWTTTDNLRGIQVYRDTDANPAGRQRIAILSGKARSYTDTSVANGQRYWYWVKYTDANRVIGNSNGANATTASAPPPTPGGCTGPAAGSHGTNPIMPGIFTADPAVLVHNCTFYITAGHDEGSNGFYMRNWYVLSSTDMVNWSNNGGPVLSLDTFRWADANAWAGQMVERNGKFYWYVPVNERGGGMAIGVAVGDSPLGPFHDAIGGPLINDAIEMRQFNYAHDYDTVFTIDPTVFVDDNGQAYLVYGGFGRMVTVALGDDMTSLKGGMTERTPQGFFEAPYLTKRNGTYYMVYAAGVNPATIDYATASSPMGPWQYRGRILDALPGLPGQDAPTSHPAIAEFAGQWYLVYHLSNGPGGGTYRRQVAIDKLTFNADGSIQKVTPTSGLVFGGNDGGRQPVSVTGVLVTPTSGTVAVGSSTALSAIVVPDNASNKTVAWSSSNAGVATVSASGVVTGVAAGNAIITARTADGGRTATSTITVSAKPDPVASYTLDVAVSGGGNTNLTGSHSYKSGTSVTITATAANGSVFSGWSGAFTGNTNPLTITMNGNKSLTAMFTTQNGGGGGQCQAYSWPGYKPDLNYDFRQDFANIDPSKFTVYEGCPKSQIAGVKTSGWYAFIWGHNRNPSITDADIDRVLKNLNEDMAYARDKFGWPPDRLPQEGHFSNIYLFGSGLCTDNAANTEKGGWQAGINGYPMVLLSYYPVVTPSERGGITHEAIHATLATMGNKAAWFNEGGNTWLQMNMEAARTGGYGVGFLDGAPFLAPHMPIENYSGWLQDGSFGGPNAEGVNRVNGNGQQISTWRAYLGGNQYNSAFAHFLALHVSPGANAWIWKKGTENGILASLAGGLGVEQTQHLIMEYRARQAMVDFGPWADGFKVPINDNWGRTVGAERIDGGILQEPAPYRLGFYAEASKQGDTLVPSTETLPGWSGANQIPLKVSGNKVRVNFKPIGQNMRLQLAYRAQDGSAVYSQPVSSGEACLNLDKAPKDGSVVAVVSNVDHLYQGEATRTRKYDYRIQLLEGVSGTASTTEKHYQ